MDQNILYKKYEDFMDRQDWKNQSWYYRSLGVSHDDSQYWFFSSLSPAYNFGLMWLSVGTGNFERLVLVITVQTMFCNIRHKIGTKFKTRRVIR